MPIKGLNPEMREVGQIRLGKMVDTGNGKRRPERLKWFEVLRSAEGGQFAYDAEVHAKIGARPTLIQVFLPGERADDVFHYELASYRSKTRPRYCWGDGESATARLFPGDFIEVKDDGVIVYRGIVDGAARSYEAEPWRKYLGDLTELAEVDGLEPFEKDGRRGFRVRETVSVRNLACSCPYMDREGDADAPKCKPHGILSVLLGENPALGSVYRFRTTSWNSIKGILAGLQQVEGLFGTLLGVPLWLGCSEIERMDPATGKKRKLVVAHLEYRKQLADGLEEHRRFMALRGDVVRRALPAPAALAPRMDDAAQAAELIEEFHPDIAAAEPPVPELAEETEAPAPEPTHEEPGGPEDPFSIPAQAAPAAPPAAKPSALEAPASPSSILFEV